MALRPIGNVGRIRGGPTALWALMPESTGDASDDQLPLSWTSYCSPWTSDHRGWAVPTCQTPGLCRPDKRITLNKLIGVTGMYLSLHKRNRMFTGDVQDRGPDVTITPQPQVSGVTDEWRHRRGQ